jgi:hypothetical protein
LWRSGDDSSGKAERPESMTSTGSVSQSSVRKSSVRQSSVRQSNPETAAVPAITNEPHSRFAAKERRNDAEGGDDESIESYMDRLLKRVRSTPPAAGSKAPSAAAPVEVAPPPAPSPARVEQIVEEPPEYLPRTAAPELPANLSAMRELANTAARTAIDRHVRKHTGRQAAGRLVAAGLTIATSALLSYWAWRAHSLQAGVGAGIGGCVGLYWTLAALRRLLGAMRLSRPQPLT